MAFTMCARVYGFETVAGSDAKRRRKAMMASRRPTCLRPDVSN